MCNLKKKIEIEYCFHFDNGNQEVFRLDFDAGNPEVPQGAPVNPPEWTHLDFYQCPNCPLKPEDHPICPMAIRLEDISGRFGSLFSYHETRLVVTTEERVISAQTTVQRAVSSLVGLIIATSGCPHTVFFRPMARFHLPLANNEETVYRAISMYLLAHYFRQQDQPGHADLKGLKDIYNNIQSVNFSMAARLRASARSDAVLNGIVKLDIHAQHLSEFMEDSLAELRPLFEF